MSVRIEALKRTQPKRSLYGLLAQMESELVIRRIGARLRDLGICFFTVHHAIFVSLERGTQAFQVIQQQVRDYGLATQVTLNNA